MKQRNNPGITKMFAGFRLTRKKINGKIESMPVASKHYLKKQLFKRLEKLSILTDLQNEIVKKQLENCDENTDKVYVARLVAVLDTPIGEPNVS